MLLLIPSENPIKCHEEVLSSQPMMPPKRFGISPPLTGGCSEGLDAFRFFFKYKYVRADSSVVCVCVVFLFILDVRLVDVPAGVTQEEGHTGFLIHLLGY